jgi:hypothetical protein
MSKVAQEKHKIQKKFKSEFLATYHGISFAPFTSPEFKTHRNGHKRYAWKISKAIHATLI